LDYFDAAYEDVYELVKGDTIYCKISAVNYWGESDLSAEGGSAVMFDVPDIPTGFADDASVTDASQIGV